MKKALIIFLFLLSQLSTFSQGLSKEEVVTQYSTALSYMTKGNRQFAEARDILERILPYAEGEIRNRIQTRIPMAWYFEGIVFQKEQKYVKALQCMEKACQGFREIGNVKNEIDALYQIGSIKNFTYNLTGAMNAYQQACNLAASVRNDNKVMEILREERKLSEQLGDSRLTLEIIQKMDSLVAAIDNNEIKFAYYNNLGDEAKGQGNYGLAEQWYRKSDNFINTLGIDYIGVNRYLHYSNLCNLFTKAGRLDDALHYAFLCKDEFQSKMKVSDKNYFMPYMRIADIYRLKDDSLQCFNTLDTLFLSLSRLDEPREAEHLYSLRGRCYSTFKEYNKALYDYRKADEILATQYDEKDGDRIRLLPLMGGMEHKLEHHEEARNLYQKYYEGMKKLYGEHKLEYIESLIYLANAEAFAGYITIACDDYVKAVNELRGLIQQKLPYLTSVERESYWNSISQLMLNMTPFALKAEKFNTKFTEACYDCLVLSKSFLLASECSTYDLIKNKGTEEDLHKYTLVNSIQTRIKELERVRNEYSDSILELTSRKRMLETQLANHCHSYGDMTSFMSIGYKEIREKLQGDDVLIDFTDFVSETQGRIYAAYMVDNKQEYPLLQRLFAESEIDSMQVSYPDRYYEGTYAKIMYKLLWEPFKDKVVEGTTVYYVPSQILFQISIESLPMEDGTLLGEHYNFVRLSSARELFRQETLVNIQNDKKTPNAILYGGLKYDMTTSEMKEQATKYDISYLQLTRGNDLRGDSIYNELPGTQKEIESIEKILKSKQLNVKPYTGKSGTEESFLDINGKAPQILHVATHGFYYTPEGAEKIEYLKGYSDAMSLSGIVMAGGNAAWLGKELPQGVLGGILTAATIARLDLTGLDLVVLSACQTGRGKTTSEGLFGLQRAFKKAGVKTIMMTLWNVSDAVTKEFMIKFYENLTCDNWNKRKAFNDAKVFIRGKYQAPYYWAGFVMLD